MIADRRPRPPESQGRLCGDEVVPIAAHDATWWLAAVRTTADEAKYRHTDEANNDGNEHHRGRKPEYLPVPSPAEIKGPIAERCAPHYLYDDHERPEDGVHPFTLPSDEAFGVHPAIMKPGVNVGNWTIVLKKLGSAAGKLVLLNRARRAAPEAVPSAPASGSAWPSGGGSGR